MPSKLERMIAEELERVVSVNQQQGPLEVLRAMTHFVSQVENAYVAGIVATFSGMSLMVNKVQPKNLTDEERADMLQWPNEFVAGCELDLTRKLNRIMGIACASRGWPNPFERNSDINKRTREEILRELEESQNE